MEKKIQKLISQLNSEKPGLSSSYQPLFIFIWLFGQNEVRITQTDLSELTGIKKRTLREHLYNLREHGYIAYSGKWDVAGKTIELLKHKHNE